MVAVAMPFHLFLPLALLLSPFFGGHGAVVLTAAGVHVMVSRGGAEEGRDPPADCAPPEQDGGSRTCLVPAGEVSFCQAGECHKVSAGPIRMDRTEVSVAQFRRCVEAGKCLRRKFQTYEESQFCNYGAPGRDDHPMNCLEWSGAKAFCEFAGKRLPTLAEWRLAAGGDGRTYPWGDAPPDCDRAIYHSEEGRGCGSMYTAPAESRPSGSSPHGILNLAGNVFEWTSTLAAGCDTAGKTAKELEEDDETMRHVAGGSFADAPETLKTRFDVIDEQESMHVGLGARCVLSAPLPTP